jgi:hypothetical protein
LRALINAGLIDPFLDGSTIRYAVIDADNEDPTVPSNDRAPQMNNRAERLLLELVLIAGDHRLAGKELGELGTSVAARDASTESNRPRS